MYNLPLELKLLTYYPIHRNNIEIYYEFLPKDYADKLALKLILKKCNELLEVMKKWNVS